MTEYHNAAEADIRDLTARFAHIVMATDYEAFADLWSAKASWEIGEPLPARAEGRDEIVDMLRRLMSQFGVFAQMTHDGLIRVNGGTASALWTVEEMGRSNDQGRSYWNIGVYEDEYAKIEGVWRFAHRSYRYVWVDDSFLPGKSFFPIRPNLPDLALTPRVPL